MPEERNSSDAVGYKKPPQASQFKPSQSGNPAGRPKNRKNARTIMRELMEEKVEVPVKGKPKKMSVLEVAVRQLMNKAMKGDLKATTMVLKLNEQLDAYDATSEGNYPRGGVLVVPGIASVDEWEKAAMVQQAELVASHR